MKKNFKLMLVALLAVFGFSNAMAAPLLNTTQYGDNGLQYKILSIKTATNDFTVSVSANVYETKGAAALTIPATVKINVKGEDEASVAVDQEIEFKVVNIAADAFKGITKITSLTIEGDNLESIEASAFENCTGLVSATFNGGLKTIKGKAFKGCSKLVTVTFPESTLADGAWLGISSAVFEGTAIKDLDLSKTKMFNVWKMFEDNNVKLQTVKMSKTVRNLKANAFANCIQLESVSFDGCSQLQTLEAGSLSNTIVSEYDFSDCYTLNTAGTAYSTFLNFAAGVNPFVNATTTTNKNLETVILPKAATLATSPVNEIGNVFANCEVLTTITNLEVSSITAVAAGAFAGDISLTELSFPGTLTTFGAAFGAGVSGKGCEKLAKLTFDGSAGVTIGNGTDPIFGAATLYDGIYPLEELYITVPATTPLTSTAATINAAALTNTGAESKLWKVEIAKGGIFAGTINNFALAESKDAEVTFGNIASSATMTGQITGPTGLKKTTLTIGEYALAATQAIVKNVISTATVAKVADNSVLTAIGQAEKIIFTSIASGSSIAAPSAYYDGLTDVTWKPADTTEDPAFKAFAQTAFGATSVGTGAKVTLHTSTGVRYDQYNDDESQLYNVIFDATAAVTDPTTITVLGNASATFYYGKAKFAANMKIAKETEAGEQVAVYSAFVDASDNKIYMDQLAIDNGYFVVEANQAVVIRLKNPVAPVDMADTDAGYVEGGKKASVVVENAGAAAPTMRYASGSTTPINDLEINTILFSSDYIGTNFVGKTLYAMKNPAKVGIMDFGKVNKKSYLPANSLYVQTDETIAAARLEVVWLDGSDATAIQSIIEKKGVESDVIYNLAGQKVGASYKGIVIKNGKKMIQK